MADLDTRSKRASSVGLLRPYVNALVLPDGTIDQGDRQHAIGAYSGILAGIPAIPEIKYFGRVIEQSSNIPANSGTVLVILSGTSPIMTFIGGGIGAGRLFSDVYASTETCIVHIYQTDSPETRWMEVLATFTNTTPKTLMFTSSDVKDGVDGAGNLVTFTSTVTCEVHVGAHTLTTFTSHIADEANPHAVTAEQVGADPVGTATSAVASHNSEADPHAGVVPIVARDGLGNVMGLSIDGVVIPIPAVVNAGTAVTTVAVAAGEHTSTAIAALGYYRVDQDMDIYIKGSDASAIYGAELTSDTDAYSTTIGSLAGQTGLDVGTADFSIEHWCQLTADTPNEARPFGWGIATGMILQTYLSANASNVLTVGIEIHNAAGGTLKTGAQTVLTGYAPGANLRHVVYNVDRGAAGGTGTVTILIDGVQVAVQTYTEAGTLDNLSCSGVAGNGRIIFGGTLNANAEWNGRIEDTKVYTGVTLSLAEVQARTNAGPLRNAAVPLDAKDLSLTWWVNFQQSGLWSNPLYPECVSGYGNAVFNSLVGSPAITERTGGTAATTGDNKLYAGKPEVVYIDNAYLSIYSDSLSAGNVRLTQVA